MVCCIMSVELWTGYSFPATRIRADMVHCNITVVTIIFCILSVILCHLKYCDMQLLNGLCKLYMYAHGEQCGNWVAM